MFKLLHTADWQMGMMSRGLGSAAEKARAARLAALKNVLELAAKHKVDAILVAGDLFEDNQVSASVLEAVLAQLNDNTNIPTYIIPGNHDPFTRDSIYRRPVWSQLRSHVHLLIRPEPVRLAEGVTLFPCPLDRKHSMDDPTAWIDSRGSEDVLRIGLAHGTMQVRQDIGGDDFPIPLDVAQRRGLDYLALGHWHSKLADPSGRVWYSGAHEATGFGERESGNALVVTLAEPRAVPQVQPIHTGVLTWADLDIDFDQTVISQAMRTLREWPDAQNTLLRLKLSGAVNVDVAAELPAMTLLLQQRFLYHSCDQESLRPASVSLDATALAGAPHLIRAAEELQKHATSPTNGFDPAVAGRALQLLYKAVWAIQRA